MIIKEVKRKYNPEINRRERYLDDREFRSLQEIKDYCVEKTNHTLINEDVKFLFTIIDTNEDIEVVGSWKMDDDGFYYVKLDYWI